MAQRTDHDDITDEELDERLTRIEHELGELERAVARLTELVEARR